MLPERRNRSQCSSRCQKLLIGPIDDSISGSNAVTTAKAMLHGKGHDVWEMIVESIP